MKTYIFEIQNCIKVSIDADNQDEAREALIDTLADFAEDMINDCVVSDGDETQEGGHKAMSLEGRLSRAKDLVDQFGDD